MHAVYSYLTILASLFEMSNQCIHAKVHELRPIAANGSFVQWKQEGPKV